MLVGNCSLHSLKKKFIFYLHIVKELGIVSLILKKEALYGLKMGTKL